MPVPLPQQLGDGADTASADMVDGLQGCEQIDRAKVSR
jgi:hypothetical protein